MKRFLFSVVLLLTLQVKGQVITTVAGGGVGDSGPATAANISGPGGICTDGSGNVYFSSGNRIRKVNASGLITTIAGCIGYGYTGDGGNATNAQLNSVKGLVFDPSGNLYAVDNGNNCVRKITPSGIISTVAGTGAYGFSGDGGHATAATFRHPVGIAYYSGNLYISDCDNNRVRMVDASGYISTIAGTGSSGYSGDGSAATSATFRHPSGIAVRASTGQIYVADCDNNRIRTIAASGVINTYAGTGSSSPVNNGPASSATFYKPYGISIDGSGNLYIADQYNNIIRKINSSSTVSTVAGNGSYAFAGDGASAVVACMKRPSFVASDASGNLFISDFENGRIRKVNTSGTISTFAGSGNGLLTSDGGLATQTGLDWSAGGFISVDAAGNTYFSSSARISKVDASGIITTIAGRIDSNGYNGDGIPGTSAMLSTPKGIASDGAGNFYIADFGGHRIRKVGVSGIISTIAGNGTAGYSGDGGAATAAQINDPSGIAVSGTGEIYFAECTNHCVRKISSSGTITTIAGTGSSGYTGDGGAATAASLNAPEGIAFDATNNLYIADRRNSVIRKVNTSGIISTIAGTGTGGYSGEGGPATAADLNAPAGVAIDIYGNLFFTDNNNNRIRKISTSGIITTIAGTGSVGYSLDGTSATVAMVYQPLGVAVNSAGDILYADAINLIRKVTAACTFPTPGPITGSSTVCAGSAISLSDTSAGGSWSVSSGSVATVNASGVVTGISGGTVTVTYSIANSCGTGRVTKSIAVSPLPVVGPVTGLSALCVGATTTYTDTSHAGVWNTPDVATATITSGGVLTGISAGSALISYSVANSCGTTTITRSVSIETTPVAGPVTGDSMVCAGIASMVSDSVGGGIWRSANTTVATVSVSGIVTGITAGSTLISYMVSNSCGSAIATMGISVLNSPSVAAITGSSTLTAGTTITLSDATAGGTWSSSNASVASVSATGVVNGVATGTAVITYSVTTGCGTGSAHKNITVTAPAAFTGIVTTIAGNGTAAYSGDGGAATAASLYYPNGIAVDASGNVYVSEPISNVVRKISPSGIITTIAGNGSAGFSGDGGQATAASLDQPGGLCVDNAGNLYIADANNSRVRKVAPSGTISTFAGNGSSTFPADSSLAVSSPLPGAVTHVNIDSYGNLYIEVSGYWVYKINTAGRIFNVMNYTSGSRYSGVVVDNAGNLFIADEPNNRILKVDASHTITAIAGVAHPQGLSIDAAGNVYATETGGSCSIKKITPSGYVSVIGGYASGGTTATYACSFSGDGGPATAATFNTPSDITIDNSGNFYVVDYSNYRIRKISACTSGSVAAISGASSVNIGASVTYSDATSGGTWSSSNTAIATVSTGGVVTGVTAGIATISYIVSSSCSTPLVTRNINVVNPLTPVFIVGSRSTKNTCADQTSNIDANLTVRDIDTGATLTWTLQTAPVHGTASVSHTATSTGGSIRPSGKTYTPASGYSGPDSFRVRISDGVLYSDLTIMVTVNPAPSIPSISGASEVCLGGTVSLTGSPAGGSFYRTTGGIVCSSSGVVTGTSVGTSAVTYQSTANSYGCRSSAWQAISVKRPIGVNSISGSSVVCQGAATIFTHAVAGGTWGTTNPALASVSGGTVTALAPGIDSITYTITDVCGTNSAFRKLIISPLPDPGTITGATTVPTGTYVTLGRTSTTAGTWASSDNTIATVGATGRVRGIMAGIDTISFSVTNSCGTARAISVISVTAGKMAGETDNNSVNNSDYFADIKVYPNPTTGYLTIELPAPGTAEIMLLSIDGKVVATTTTTNAKTTINCSDMSSGMYLLRIKAGGKLIDKKIIVE